MIIADGRRFGHPLHQDIFTVHGIYNQSTFTFWLFANIYLFCVRVSPPTPEFNVGTLVPEKNTTQPEHPRSFGEETQRKVNTSTVDGKYKQSGFVWKELNCGFHCPPYPLNSKLGSSGRVVFFFWDERANIELGG